MTEYQEYHRVVLITGSNAGVGFELCRILAQRGHIVYMASRIEEVGKESQAQMKQEHGLDVHLVQLDVTDTQSILAARDLIEREQGRLDNLVNNAALFLHDEDQNAVSISASTLRKMFAVNFNGLVEVTTTFLPLLRKSPKGHAAILNISSRLGSNTFMAANRGPYTATAYRTSKAAVNAYTIELAWELKEELEGIKVNSVTPGFVSTRANHFAKTAGTAEDGAKVLLPWVLLGPEDSEKTGLFWGPTGQMAW